MKITHAVVQNPGVQKLLLLDSALLLRLVSRPEGRLSPLFRGVAHLGEPVLLLVVLPALLGTLSMAGWIPVTAPTALVLATSLALTAVQLLKRVCRRARPSDGLEGFTPRIDAPQAFSFPSCHAALAFAAAGTLAAHGLVPAALAFTLASGVALSRVYLGVHYPLDVTAGAILGGLASWGAQGLLGPG